MLGAKFGTLIVAVGTGSHTKGGNTSNFCLKKHNRKRKNARVQKGIDKGQPLRQGNPLRRSVGRPSPTPAPANTRLSSLVFGAFDFFALRRGSKRAAAP